MLNQTNLRRYAERLAGESEVFSAEESVGIRILTLQEHAYNPKMVLEKLERDLREARAAREDTTALEAAIKKIKEG